MPRAQIDEAVANVFQHSYEKSDPSGNRRLYIGHDSFWTDGIPHGRPGGLVYWVGIFRNGAAATGCWS